MTQPQPQPIGLQRLGWLLVVTLLGIVPFAGLLLDAPLEWYLTTPAYLMALSRYVKMT